MNIYELNKLLTSAMHNSSVFLKNFFHLFASYGDRFFICYEQLNREIQQYVLLWSTFNGKTLGYLIHIVFADWHALLIMQSSIHCAVVVFFFLVFVFSSYDVCWFFFLSPVNRLLSYDSFFSPLYTHFCLNRMMNICIHFRFF